MNPNKALWEKGDFTRIAATMRESGEALVERSGSQGMRVLDLGCGDGTTALPRRGSAPTCSASTSRETSSRRATGAREAEGLDELPVPGGRRDQPRGAERRLVRPDVVSIFGAMFAPKPFDVAKEMVRVTKPGGRIVMGNWIPNDPTLVAQILKISSAYSPPPPEGFISPMTWGIESNVIERFTAAGIPKENILFVRERSTVRLPAPSAGARGRVPLYYQADHEHVRGGRGDGLTEELEGGI